MPFLLMRFGSLFSGIGGLDLGLERAGFTCRWQSEIDPYASRVLTKHWPNVPNLGDIKNIDWTTTPAVDLVCGGYPCQPFSTAGLRNGTDDPRHLWPYFADCLRILRPRFALLENVPGHLSLGFGDVQTDLAALGYNTEWDCIPAAAVGAPHLRDRIFVIATRQTVGMDTDSNSKSDGTVNAATKPWPSPMADTDSTRREKQHVATVTTDARFNTGPTNQKQRMWQPKSDVADTDLYIMGRNRPTTNPRTPSRNRQHHAGRETCNECRQWWETEPDVGRVADGVPSRVDRLRGLGNAVVPQVAQHLGNIIKDIAQ